jgi:hypothetical protein
MGLAIDFRLRSGHGDLLALSDRNAQLPTEGGSQIDDAAILKGQAADFAGRTRIEAADS